MPFRSYFSRTLTTICAFFAANILIAIIAAATSCCLNIMESTIWSGYQPPVIQDIYLWNEHIEFYMVSFTASLALAPLYLLYILIDFRLNIITRLKSLIKTREIKLDRVFFMTLAAYGFFGFMAAAPWTTHQVSLNPADPYGIANPATFYLFNIFPLYLFTFLIALSFG